jgi:hypothetical protein
VWGFESLRPHHEKGTFPAVVEPESHLTVFGRPEGLP